MNALCEMFVHAQFNQDLSGSTIAGELASECGGLSVCASFQGCLAIA